MAVIAYELILVGLSQLVAPHLNDVVTVSMSRSWIGSLVGLAMNLLGITKIKVLNFLPAILCRFYLYHYLRYFKNKKTPDQEFSWSGVFVFISYFLLLIFQKASCKIDFNVFADKFIFSCSESARGISMI